MGKSKLQTQDLCHIGIFAALIALLAQLSIPMPGGVPMTLQTFVIAFAGITLGSRKGLLAALLYLLLGAVGIPVFAQFGAGIGILLGPRGGFLLSFPLVALLAGIGWERGRRAGRILGLVAGTSLNFICGMAWFMAVTQAGFATALATTVLPFIPTTILQLLLAVGAGERCRRMIAAA